jgi:lysophospholipase L1-like esterase
MFKTIVFEKMKQGTFIFIFNSLVKRSIMRYFKIPSLNPVASIIIRDRSAMPYQNRLLSAITIILASFSLSSGQVASQTKDDGPEKFEKEIKAFEKIDQTARYVKDMVVFTGSSTTKNWHKDLPVDFEGLPVLGRGFGGSRMNDLLYFMDRVVLKYQPKAVVVYEGDNDINSGKSTDQIMKEFQQFEKRFHQALPESIIYFISVKPSPKRWEKWPLMKKFNSDLKTWAATRKNVNVIDITSTILGPDGLPDKSLFKDDMLHMNRKGYERWQQVIKPILMKDLAGK